ncbi:MAG: hypothetical protein AB1413_02585 [Thermodesulfobacteriota bacterium]
MSGIDLVIGKSGFTLFPPGGLAPLATCASVEELLARLAESCASQQHTATELTLYVTEELLFATEFALPAKTPKLAEAIRFQLGMVVPFGDNTFRYRYTTRREGDQQKILLYALRDETVLSALEALAAAGHTFTGLFPEHQRLVTRAVPKAAWALLLDGRTSYFFTFHKGQLSGRTLCRQVPTREEMAALAGSDTLYGASDPTRHGLLTPTPLLAAKPLHKHFDLLPETFRRPDYFRNIIAGLLIANLVLLVLFGGFRFFQTIRLSRTVEREISAIMPQVKVANDLLGRAEKLEGQIALFRDIGSNPDLVGFMAKLTTQLPPGCYLDQLRLEKRGGSYLLDGYATDISSLTAALQTLGEVKLKSTSRRQNQNYFQLEIVPR